MKILFYLDIISKYSCERIVTKNCVIILHREKSLGNFHASEVLMKKGRNAVHEKGGGGTRLTKEKEVKKKKKNAISSKNSPSNLIY